MRCGKDEIGVNGQSDRSAMQAAQHRAARGNPVKSLFAFLCVGLVFLTLFLPYLAWKMVEARINGLLSEAVIISRLGGMALREMFRDETVG